MFGFVHLEISDSMDTVTFLSHIFVHVFEPAKQGQLTKTEPAQPTCEPSPQTGPGSEHGPLLPGARSAQLR